jgi:1,4-dihydroxy-2-naphthoate octaprenyltransferase
VTLEGIRDDSGMLYRWWLAVRPKTLPAAASGVVVGTALAWRDGRFSVGPALAALGVALLLQIASNLANDVFDDERGADTADRLGPVRVTQAGLLRRGQVKRGVLVVVGCALAIGVYLTAVRGAAVPALGMAAIVAAVAYSGGPWPLGYHGLGEVFVLVFFGLAAVVGTYWVQTGGASLLAWLMAAAVGAPVTAIIVVNNLRDIEQDRVAGKRTVAVRVGVGATRVEYAALMAVPYLLVAVLVVAGMAPPAAMLSWISLPLCLRATRRVFAQTGRALNLALAETGQATLAYSALFALGVVLAR